MRGEREAAIISRGGGVGLAEAAQHIAEALMQAGIRAILCNRASARIKQLCGNPEAARQDGPILRVMVFR